MLGNSLNPSSSMAQKMANNLTKEIETHKMFNSESNLSTSASKKALTGPQLQRRNPKPQNQQVCDPYYLMNLDSTLPLKKY